MISFITIESNEHAPKHKHKHYQQLNLLICCFFSCFCFVLCLGFLGQRNNKNYGDIRQWAQDEVVVQEMMMMRMMNKDFLTVNWWVVVCAPVRWERDKRSVNWSWIQCPSCRLEWYYTIDEWWMMTCCVKNCLNIWSVWEYVDRRIHIIISFY